MSACTKHLWYFNVFYISLEIHLRLVLLFVFCFVFIFFYWDGTSGSPGWLGTHYVGKAGLDFLTFLVVPPLCYEVVEVPYWQDTVQEWSGVKRILSACEKTPRKQDKGLMTSGLADRSEFTSNYSYNRLRLFVYMSLWKNPLLPCTACPCDCIQVELMRTLLLLNPQGI